MFRIDSWHRKISTGRHFQNGHHNTAQIQHCSISTSWIDSWHRKISTGRHFQNGCHNTAKIQHCSISKVAFNLFFKPVVCGEIFRCQESFRDIIIYPHMKCRWNWTMLNLCGIVVAILKMATSRNFSMLGINSGHHYLPTSNFDDIGQCW
jgi:hypothetical protein